MRRSVLPWVRWQLYPQPGLPQTLPSRSILDAVRLLARPTISRGLWQLARASEGWRPVTNGKRPGKRRPKPTPSHAVEVCALRGAAALSPCLGLIFLANREFDPGGRGMAGSYAGYHVIRRKYDELRFEVFWQNEGWFWRPLLTLDGKTVGPFTKSSEAYQSAVASNPPVRPRLTGRAAR